MPKYNVVHSVLTSTPYVDDPREGKTHVFRQDQVVTEADLKRAGFDVQFLKDAGAIEALKGTDDDDAPPEPPTTTAGASPAAGDVPNVTPVAARAGAVTPGESPPTLAETRQAERDTAKERKAAETAHAREVKDSGKSNR